MGLWEFVKDFLRYLVAALWNRITEGIEPGERPETDAPKYTLEYPKEYVKQYLSNGMNGYRGPSPYGSLDDLYRNNGLVYGRPKFKYGKEINNHEA